MFMNDLNLTLTKWSVKDYHQMINAGILQNRSVELLAGNIVEMTPEKPLHTVYGEGLAYFLRQALTDRAWVREARPITLLDSEPEPDIAVVELPWFQYSQHHPYPENIFWVIEVSDTTLVKDINEKKVIYGKAGIQEYWVLDVKARKIIVFRDPTPNGYNNCEEISQGSLTPLAFSDISIPIEQVFSGQIVN